LRRALKEQFADLGQPTGDSMPGPWRNFFVEGSEWPSEVRLDHDLYEELKRCFDTNVTREILFAAADMKISRVTLKQKYVGRLQAIADRFGFALACSAIKCVPIVDCGKGRWANRGRPATRANEKGALCNVYIASGGALAETGRMLDEAGEDDLFGALLGIPACCRRAYDLFRPLAAEKQNDFLPFVLDNTRGSMPFDWRLNYAAQYFGPSLLSFFPCSFDCPAAARVAETTFKMLSCCDSQWAGEFVEFQRGNVIYTENRGLHLIRAPFTRDRIVYDAQDLVSTEISDVTALLRQGDMVEVDDKHTIRVYRGSILLGRLTGDDVSVCVFH
jgi:hypothetical protein